MLCEVLGLDRVGLYLNFDKPLTEAELLLFRGMVARRRSVSPSSIFSGARNLWGLSSRFRLPFSFPGMIRRPWWLKPCALAAKHAVCWISASVAAVLRLSWQNFFRLAEMHGVDTSPEALALACRNAERNGVTVTLRGRFPVCAICGGAI